MKWLFEKNTLENGSHTAIFRYIEENPETYLQKIIHETNISRGTVLYHLDILLYSKLRKYRAAQKAVTNDKCAGI